MCWRIRGSDLSLLPWSWGLCIFVEQLCLVASRQVSRHLRGRSVCRASYPPPPPSPLSSFLRVLCSSAAPTPLLHAEYPWAPDQTSKQTEQQKNPSPRQGWSGLGGLEGVGWGGRWGEILFAFWASSISPWWQRRPPRTRLSTLMFEFQRGSRWTSVCADTSSSDPIHSWLRPQACSLYLSWSCSLLLWAWPFCEGLVGVAFSWWPFILTMPSVSHNQ